MGDYNMHIISHRCLSETEGIPIRGKKSRVPTFVVCVCVSLSADPEVTPTTRVQFTQCRETIRKRNSHGCESLVAFAVLHPMPIYQVIIPYNHRRFRTVPLR